MSAQYVMNTYNPNPVAFARGEGAYLYDTDGKRYLEHVLPAPVSGRVGLWSKADSHMYFDDYTVTPAD